MCQTLCDIYISKFMNGSQHPSFITFISQERRLRFRSYKCLAKVHLEIRIYDYKAYYTY